eukprot:5071035-Karenia_brevis.AAC.1
MALLLEGCQEFQVPIWICALDFQKAFDTVEHEFLLEALVCQGVPAAYVSLLASLYSEQVGQIRGRATSKPYQILRGTKQGDPLSPILFNAVLEKALGPCQSRWREKKFGIKCGHLEGDLLCKLCFADDLLLIAASEWQLKKI